MTPPNAVAELGPVSAARPSRSHTIAPISTRAFPRWGEAMTEHVLTMRAENLATTDRFFGQASIARFHRCVVADMHTTAHRVLRTRTEMAADEDRYFKVMWQMTGHNEILRKGHTVKIEAGQWAIYDTSQPYSVATGDDSRFLMLLLPVSEMGRWMPGIEFVTGKAMPTRGTAEIARSALAGMLSAGIELEQDGAVVMQDSIGALIGTAIAQVYGTSTQEHGAINRRLQKAQAYIESHLDDPALGPEAVAVACGMSRRSLYTAFNALAQTPNHYILQRRLDVACKRMVDPALRATITQVAFELGFSDGAHFSRAFSEKYGMSPSQWRSRQIAAAG